MPSVCTFCPFTFFVFLELLHTPVSLHSMLCILCILSYLIHFFFSSGAFKRTHIFTLYESYVPTYHLHQLQLPNLSIFPFCMFLCNFFSNQLTYLHSISSCLFFFISCFLCESFHWHSIISPHPLSQSTLSPPPSLFPKITSNYSPLSSFTLPLPLLGLGRCWGLGWLCG